MATKQQLLELECNLSVKIDRQAETIIGLGMVLARGSVVKGGEVIELDKPQTDVRRKHMHSTLRHREELIAERKRILADLA